MFFPAGMAFHRNPQDDPYLKNNEDSEDSGDEAEDLRLRETDLLILAARNEDDVSYLEVCGVCSCALANRCSRERGRRQRLEVQWPTRNRKCLQGHEHCLRPACHCRCGCPRSRMSAINSFPNYT